MTTPASAAADVPAVRVAVVVDRTAAPNAWEDWGFRIADVVPHEDAFGDAPRLLHDDGRHARWLHPGFEVALHVDECKGYFLNLTSGTPSWFVSWRHDEDDASRIDVTAVSLSYIEADRRLFAEEQLASLPLEPTLCEWLREFTHVHFKPDEKRRVRAASFVDPGRRDDALRTPPAGDA